MNVSMSKHSAEEAETWARAMLMAMGEDPDRELGMPLEPVWKSYIPAARMALMARDHVAAGAPLKLQLTF